MPDIEPIAQANPIKTNVRFIQFLLKTKLILCPAPKGNRGKPHRIWRLKSEESNGKKLGFITQEIGREINTIGSKANDAVLQQLVVQMKDELEKIKEQVLNVL